MDSVEQEREFDPGEEERQERIKRMPILEQCYNLMDFEAVARRVMKKTAWAYYSSGADDEIVSLQDQLPVSTLTYHRRQCEKIIPHITRFSLDPVFLSTCKISTSLRLCSEPK